MKNIVCFLFGLSALACVAESRIVGGPDDPDNPTNPVQIASLIVDDIARRMMFIRDCKRPFDEDETPDVFDTISLLGSFLLNGCDQNKKTTPPDGGPEPTTPEPENSDSDESDEEPARSLNQLLVRELENYLQKKQRT